MTLKLRRGLLSGLALVFLVSCTCQQKGVLATDPEKTFYVNLIPGSNLKDPLNNLDLERLKILSLVYEGLLRYSSSGELAPVLLAELPTLSADQLTYNFKLKQTVFHATPELTETRTLNSKDVVMSLLRGLIESNSTTYARLLTGLIEGAASWSQSSASGEWFGRALPSGFKIKNDLEFSIKLLRPYPDFLALLTLPAFSVVPAEFLKGGQLLKAIGTGPYSFVDKDVDSVNWNLNGADSLKFAHVNLISKPDLESVKASDYSSLNIKLASEVIDANGSLKTMPEHSLKNLRLRRLELLVLNLKDPVLKKLGVDFRRALLSAVNPELLLQQMYKGMGQVAFQFIPPGVEGALSEETLKLLPKDQAVQKLKKSLGKNKIKVIYPESTKYWVQSLEQELKDLASNFEFQVVDSSGYLEKIEKGEFQIAPLSWEGDLPEATNYLQLYFSGTQKNEQNLSGYKSNAFDQAFDKLSKLFPSPERRKLAEAAHKIVLSDLPSLPLGYKMDFVVLSKRASGLTTEALDTNALKDFLVSQK